MKTPKRTTYKIKLSEDEVNRLIDCLIIIQGDATNWLRNYNKSNLTYFKINRILKQITYREKTDEK